MKKSKKRRTIAQVAREALGSCVSAGGASGRGLGGPGRGLGGLQEL